MQAVAFDETTAIRDKNVFYILRVIEQDEVARAYSDGDNIAALTSKALEEPEPISGKRDEMLAGGNF